MIIFVIIKRSIWLYEKLIIGIEQIVNEWVLLFFEELIMVFLNSIQGRNGKGVVYVFAAGNGGKDDNCNADGNISNLYTIPITSIGIDQKAAPYSEVCASAFSATYSSISERFLVIY